MTFMSSCDDMKSILQYSSLGANKDQDFRQFDGGRGGVVELKEDMMKVTEEKETEEKEDMKKVTRG